MRKLLRITIITVVFIVAATALVTFWFFKHKQPQRSGALALAQLTAPVSVDYDERGVPHIRASNEADMYRALGFVHAQDRLFQMEMLRRLARGELAEILGPKLLDTDKLFRTLGIRQRADAAAARLDPNIPSQKALLAYLDGINQFQTQRPAPIEFDILGIPKRPFTVADSLSVNGYLAYSFASAFRTDPVLTFVRDSLGTDYLQIFETELQSKGLARKGVIPTTNRIAKLHPRDWQDLGLLAKLSQQTLQEMGIPQFEGSNAWVIAGQRTRSGKPILAGDPHIAYSEPSVWYEAHLKSPDFELYGHHLALNSSALLGHNTEFGWSLTMFQNDDMDLIAETVNPANPQQVRYHKQWVTLTSRVETILVKGGAPVKHIVRASPHGPIVNDAMRTMGAPVGDTNKTPIAMWWAYLETENPVHAALYNMNRANTLAKARTASSQIHAPGLNILWANTAGDIAWWAAAKVPKRPAGINPMFILNGNSNDADIDGFYAFSENPQEENPHRGYIVSANHAPAPSEAVPVPGYYNLPERALRLDETLRNPGVQWDIKNNQALQLDTQTHYSNNLLKPLLPELRKTVTDPAERELLDRLAAWDGQYTLKSIEPSLFSQFVYQLAEGTMADKMTDELFKSMLKTRALDSALVHLAQDAKSPWWDNRKTPATETRADTLHIIWKATLAHLHTTLGLQTSDWAWGKAHTLTHSHPLAKQKPFDLLFNVGPYAAPGGREVLNNLSGSIGPAPWSIVYGPSTRRVIDFADPGHSVGINPVGQSGVPFDRHYADQAVPFIAGGYQPQHFNADDVRQHTRSTLLLEPAR